METSNGQPKTEAQEIFINPFIVCSSCKGKFVGCSFADAETNGSYPFANGRNRLNGLAIYDGRTCSMDMNLDLKHLVAMSHKHGNTVDIQLVHVHDARLSPCCVSMSMLHIHVLNACLCPCCKSMSMLHV
jgi:hypothetical protein